MGKKPERKTVDALLLHANSGARLIVTLTSTGQIDPVRERHEAGTFEL